MNTVITTWLLLAINGFQYFYIMCVFFERRIKSLLLSGVVYTGICLIIRYLTGLTEGALYAIGGSVSILLQILILYPLFHIRKWYHAWVLQGGFMAGMILLQIPTIFLAELITGSNVLEEVNTSNFDLNYVISASLNCMIYMVVIFIVYIIRFAIHYSASRIILFATIGVVIYQTLVMIFFYMLCWENGENAVMGGVLFVIFSIVSQMAILKSIESILEKGRIEREYSQLSNLRKREYEHYQMVQEEIERLRLERHDYINYLQAIHRFLDETSNYEEVKELLQELRQKYDNEE